MSNIEGTVDYINTRQVNIKNGPRAGSTATVYTMTVSGEDIDYGFTKPPFEEGEMVSVPVGAKNRFGKWEPANKQKGSNGAGPAPRQNTRNSYNKREDSGFPIPTDSYQVSIIRQNALTNAVNLITEAGYVVDWDKNSDEIIETVIKTAYKFYEFSSGQREVKIARSLGGGPMTTNDNEDD